jgi:hypothetical protein
MPDLPSRESAKSPGNDRNDLFGGATVFSKATRFDYLKLPQKRWMRLQASSRSEVLVA